MTTMLEKRRKLDAPVLTDPAQVWRAKLRPPIRTLPRKPREPRERKASGDTLPAGSRVRFTAVVMSDSPEQSIAAGLEARGFRVTRIGARRATGGGRVPYGAPAIMPAVVSVVVTVEATAIENKGGLSDARGDFSRALSAHGLSASNIGVELLAGTGDTHGDETDTTGGETTTAAPSTVLGFEITPARLAIGGIAALIGIVALSSGGGRSRG